VARLFHKVTRLLQRASLPALISSIALVSYVSAATHIAAVTKNSVPAPSKAARKLPIDIVSSKIDYKGDSVDFQNVTITQGDTKVQADRAHVTGLDTDNSHWTFEGNVRINGEQHGSLKSDAAVVEFRNKYISKATVTGSPAEFEQKRTDTDEVARGHAKEIVYNVSDGTVRLSKGPAGRPVDDDAWIWDGHNALSAPELVYNIREQHVQAAAEPGNQVHLTIDPNKTEDPNKKP
jgi:lipopolysaccharide transport protein LptA